MQQEDPFCKRIMSLLKSSKLQVNNLHYIENKLLMRNITDNKQCFHTVVLPQILTAPLVRAAHDELGHNSSTRTYILVHRLYYWTVLKASVNKHIKQCMTCQKRNMTLGNVMVQHYTFHPKAANAMYVQWIYIDPIASLPARTSLCSDSGMYIDRV